jgi:hypothetical protein
MLVPLIEKRLAVGPSHDFGGLSLADLKKEGITAVIDLNQDSEEMGEASKAGLMYVADPGLNILDNSQPISIDALEYVTTRVHRLISQGHYVYLHCSASRGRSPTIAAAYLICLGKEREEAMNLVRRVRSEAWSGRDGNYPAFLDKFEKGYRGKWIS